MSDWDLEELSDWVEEIVYDGPRGQEAERLLEVAESLETGEPPRAECLRSAVWWLTLRGEHDQALRCVELAVADGGPTWIDPRVDELHVLLRLGDPRADDVERALRKTLDKQPNADIAIEMVADDLESQGRLKDAARWYTLALGDLRPEEIDVDDVSLLRPLTCRARVRRDLGLPMDRYDHVAKQAQHAYDETRRARDGDSGYATDDASVTVLWWPPEEFALLVERWPDMAEGYGGSADGHRAATEDHLRQYADRGMRTSVAAGNLADFLAMSEQAGEDPRSGAARAHYAAELGRTGHAVPWPPGRNDPCWCGSGAKYKRCCGSAAARQ